MSLVSRASHSFSVYAHARANVGGGREGKIRLARETTSSCSYKQKKQEKVVTSTVEKETNKNHLKCKTHA